MSCFLLLNAYPTIEILKKYFASLLVHIHGFQMQVCDKVDMGGERYLNIFGICFFHSRFFNI